MGEKPKHYMGRPPRTARDVLRLNARGRWVPDDGKPGRAFSGIDKLGFPTAWYPDCLCNWGNAWCPAELSVQRTMTRCASVQYRKMRRARA